VVVLLLDSSLLVSAYLPNDHHSRAHSPQQGPSPLALLATPAGIWAFTDGRPLSANMSTRGEIIAFILTNPGVYLREISDDLALPMGVVQYHLQVLGKNGELEEYRSGRYRRFFGANRYPEGERRVLALLRQGTSGRILVALAQEPLSHLRLARALGISSQALSWHMRRLREMGIVLIKVSSNGIRQYALADGFRQEMQGTAFPMQRGTPS